MTFLRLTPTGSNYFDIPIHTEETSFQNNAILLFNSYKYDYLQRNLEFKALLETFEKILKDLFQGKLEVYLKLRVKRYVKISANESLLPIYINPRLLVSKYLNITGSKKYYHQLYEDDIYRWTGYLEAI